MHFRRLFQMYSYLLTCHSPAFFFSNLALSEFCHNNVVIFLFLIVCMFAVIYAWVCALEYQVLLSCSYSCELPNISAENSGHLKVQYILITNISSTEKFPLLPTHTHTELCNWGNILKARFTLWRTAHL